MLTNEAWDGVSALLDEYMKVRIDDVVVIAYTDDSRECAAWVSATLESRGIDTRMVLMRALRDDGFKARLSAALPSPCDLHGRVVLAVFEVETMSHSREVREALSKFDSNRCMVIRSMSSYPELFAEALHARPAELSARNAAILSRCIGASTLRIECSGGTKLNVTLNGECYEWISNRGMWRPGSFIILPAGEVATYPASVEGVLVADVAFNLNTFTERDARLQGAPVTIVVKRGRAVEHHCADPEIEQFIGECLAVPNGKNVGEIGFGTNHRITKPLSMNSHINERIPGVHLGFGQHNQPSAVDYFCMLHLDLIARGGKIWIDDHPVPLDLLDLAPCTDMHPKGPRDEDVFSPIDSVNGGCCGILDRDM